MRLSMYANFNLLKKAGNGEYVPVKEGDVESLSIGGFYFDVGDKRVPFDWTAQSGSWRDDGSLEFNMGYGLLNDFELDECFNKEYAKLNIKREDISAKMLAAAHNINEFYVDLEVKTSDGIKECGLGDNTDKKADYKLELLNVIFIDIETDMQYPVSSAVLDAFNKGKELKFNSLSAVLADAEVRSEQHKGNENVALEMEKI